MISESALLVTVTDLLVLGAVAYALFVLFSIWKNLTTAKARFGLVGVVLGLSLTALISLADLLMVHVPPSRPPVSGVMAIMRDLHLNYRWLVTVSGPLGSDHLPVVVDLFVP